MMLLISLAIVVAFVASLASEFGWLDLEFWWELALLIDVMLLGHWREMKALGQTSSALEALAALLPDEAEMLHGTMTHTVPARRPEPWRPRPRPPGWPRAGRRHRRRGRSRDGRVDDHRGIATVHRHPGDRVVAGTVATDSLLRVRVEAARMTALAGIRRLVEQAQASRSRAQALADRAAALLFYVALTAGALTFVVWTAIGETSEAVEQNDHRPGYLVPPRRSGWRSRW